MMEYTTGDEMNYLRGLGTWCLRMSTVPRKRLLSEYLEIFNTRPVETLGDLDPVKVRRFVELELRQLGRVIAPESPHD